MEYDQFMVFSIVEYYLPNGKKNVYIYNKVLLHNSILCKQYFYREYEL